MFQEWCPPGMPCVVCGKLFAPGEPFSVRQDIKAPPLAQPLPVHDACMEADAKSDAPTLRHTIIRTAWQAAEARARRDEVRESWQGNDDQIDR